jgi:hypothetical protein
MTSPGFARRALADRLRLLGESAGYRNYLRVREHVLDMKDRERAGVGAPSEYWRMELDHLDFIFDASPIVIDDLRGHSYGITGVRPYDYRDVVSGKGGRAGFEAKLQALRALDERGLLVPEASLLGGFGYEIDGALYNIDTLKFYEVLIGLERAGFLEEFRSGAGRCMCEIGPGWGGFAYQFKTLFPNATIVLVDFPELFLFSATYLLTAFPDARAAFWGGPGGEQPGTQLDFVFVANSEIASFAPAALDLTVNMVSFQEMTTEQVRSYVAWAAAHGSRRLYSLNRDRSRYNAELSSVRELMAEAYDIQEVDVLPVPYTRLVDPWAAAKPASKPRRRLGRPTRPAAAAPAGDRYRHVAGVALDRLVSHH